MATNYCSLCQVDTLKSIIVGTCFVILIMLATAAAAQAPNHPLDGLTAQDYWAVYDALRASNHVDAKTRYPFTTLHEPAKDEVLRWKPGQPFRREALAVVKQGPRTYEAIIDVSLRKLVSWKEIPGVQPNLIEEEVLGIDEGVKTNPEWQAAMRRRGITDYDAVFCLGSSPGYFGEGE